MIGVHTTARSMAVLLTESIFWGEDTNMVTEVPALTSPSMVALAATHTFAMPEEGVLCWGSNEHEETSVPLQ